MERRLHPDQGNSLDVFQNFVIGSAFLACAFETPRIASRVPGGNQDAKMDHLFQRDRTCGHSSIDISRGFRSGLGSDRSAASTATVSRTDEANVGRIQSGV